MPIITSMYWLINESPSLQMAAFSILLLSFKFLLFFRVFQSYGKYFAIIIGVAKEVFLIIFGFGSAFFILLRSTDPWNLTTKYSFINPDRTTNSSYPILAQIPDSNTNMFNWFSTSILAVYLLLIGKFMNLLVIFF